MKQNADHDGISQSKIDALDSQWRAEIGSADTPLQTEVLGNPVSTHLKDKQSAANELVSEVFVMDSYGLNVGQSAVTSDYWQGDEAKFQESFGAGTGGVHIGDVELDESTGDYVVQVSMTISDPESGSPIGAVTYAINMGVLE
ncbi:PDC sensor domain-containing protein [Halocynthiibacter sp. C4]|uniref:PDC sensor domain-containing protein n=1 Tax=Halocynthiibacter sp. C4 TaxID=2992758 RepID=UPI00237B2F13|nr:PDC sensor domain-containing protein [Halocynthiibacter sp. C4]MDE0591142.1 PDC sensor domain-containing protein [Halocynthiibacter sp. C4]